MLDVLTVHERMFVYFILFLHSFLSYLFSIVLCTISYTIPMLFLITISHSIPYTITHTISPPVLDLRNPSLKDRHWALINNLTGTDIRAIPDFTLSNLLSSGVTTYREEITFISSSAQQESILVSDLVYYSYYVIIHFVCLK